MNAQTIPQNVLSASGWRYGTIGIQRNRISLVPQLAGDPDANDDVLIIPLGVHLEGPLHQPGAARVESGAWADLVVLDRELRLIAVCVEGEPVEPIPL